MTDIAERIAKYKELLDSGALTQEEFDALKAKALTEELGRPIVAEPEATEIAEPDVAETTESDVVEMQPETSDSNDESALGNPQPEVTPIEAKPAEPVDVTFTIERNRMFPEVKGADGSQYEDGFIKPKGQTVKAFCAEVAEMMERRLGRPVRWRFAGTRKKFKGGGQSPEERRKGFMMTAAAVALVLGVALAWHLFSNRVTYKGDVRGLVEHCQTMRKSDREVVEVSGYVFVADKDKASSGTILTPDGTLKGYHAMVSFKESQRMYDGERMTLRGVVQGYSVKNDHVSVSDAEVVR